MPGSTALDSAAINSQAQCIMEGNPEGMPELIVCHRNTTLLFSLIIEG